MSDIEDQPQSSDNNKPSDDKTRADRREILRLGLAGMPMMLTLKASAQQAVVSQLQCAFRVPERLRVMVSADGTAWASTTHNVRFSNRRQAFRAEDLNEFISPGNSTRFDGGVPEVYRPQACATPPDPDSDWVDCGWNKFTIGRNLQITPADYLSNGTFQINGDEQGLYLALTLQYASQTSSANWPGLSCVVSILNYLGQN